MTFKDPVLGAINQYTQENKSDSIRMEISVFMEILRCKQYADSTIVEQVLDAKNIVYNNLIKARPAYLELKFREFLRTVPFYKRASYRASSGTWKVLYYEQQRNLAVSEIIKRINAAKAITEEESEV